MPYCAALAINLRKILRQLALLCVRLGISLNRLLIGNMSNLQLGS
jgi:IS5 family transposase